MLNEYSSSGGTATVYIRYAADLTDHKEGELAAVFSNCNFELIFDNNSKNIQRNSNLLNNFKLNFNSIVLRPRNFSEDIYKFISYQQENENTEIPVMHEIVTDDNGEAFLNYTPSSEVTV